MGGFIAGGLITGGVKIGGFITGGVKIGGLIVGGLITGGVKMGEFIVVGGLLEYVTVDCKGWKATGANNGILYIQSVY